MVRDCSPLPILGRGRGVGAEPHSRLSIVSNGNTVKIHSQYYGEGHSWTTPAHFQH